MKLKLQKISTTKTQSAFMLSFGEHASRINKVFMTNTEESDKFWITELSNVSATDVKQTCKYNKNSLYCNDNKTVYYPMYDSS